MTELEQLTQDLEQTRGVLGFVLMHIGHEIVVPKDTLVNGFPNNAGIYVLGDADGGMRLGIEYNE